MTENGLQVTPASAWEKQTELVELPSGKVAELQRPDMIDMVLRDGSIPDSLASLVVESITTGARTEWKPTTDELPGIANLLDTLCKACFVYPRVVESEPDYDAGEIALKDVKSIDRMWLMSWAMDGGEEASAARNFSGKQVRNVHPVSDG
jgi:hypothetical protein